MWRLSHHRHNYASRRRGPFSCLCRHSVQFFLLSGVTPLSLSHFTSIVSAGVVRRSLTQPIPNHSSRLIALATVALSGFCASFSISLIITSLNWLATARAANDANHHRYANGSSSPMAISLTPLLSFHHFRSPHGAYRAASTLPGPADHTPQNILPRPTSLFLVRSSIPVSVSTLVSSPVNSPALEPARRRSCPHSRRLLTI